QAWFVHFTLGVYVAKKTGALIWINGVGAAITVMFSLWLVPRYGLWGAVWAAVACYAVMAVLMTRKSQALYRIDLDWPRLLPLFVWLLLAFAAGSWVQAHPETGYAARFVLLGAGLAFPFLSGAVTKREWEIAKALVRRQRAEGRG